MPAAHVPGMAAPLFWCVKGLKILIWYTGSFSSNSEEQNSVLNFGNFIAGLEVSFSQGLLGIGYNLLKTVGCLTLSFNFGNKYKSQGDKPGE